MPRSQYAGTPAQPPAPVCTAISGSVTSTAAGTYHCWLQYQARGGFSLISDRVEIAIAANQGLQVVIPISAQPSPNGADIRRYHVLISDSSDPATAVIAVTQPGYSGETVLNPPFTLTLTRDEHFNTSALAVATASALPQGSDRKNGMRRSVDDQAGRIYEWSDGESAWLTAIPQDLTPYIATLTARYGANQSLSTITEQGDVIFPDYGLSGDSESLLYWIVNDGAANIAAGKRISLTLTAKFAGVEVDVSNHPALLGGVKVAFMGYANAATGVLDTTGPGGVGTMTGIGEPLDWVGTNTVLQTQKVLPPNTAYVLKVWLNTDVANLGGQLPDNTILSISPSFFAVAAVPNQAALITGSTILGDSDRRRLVPTLGTNALALDGAGMIKLPSGGGYSFSGVGQQEVSGLDVDTADQLVVINLAGECIVVDAVPDYAALRCIVGTVDGHGRPTAWSAPVSLSNSVYLQVEVDYPTAIRADYDDPIAGSTQGSFNADTVRIYVRNTSSGNAFYWDRPVTPGIASETFTLGVQAGTDSGGTEPPTPASDRFGLYESTVADLTLTTPAGSSTFATGTYVVAISYGYENTITSLDHREISGCIGEVSGTLADAMALLDYLGPPVDSLWDLRSVAAGDRVGQKEIYAAEANNPYRWKPSETRTTEADLTFSATTTAGAASGELRLNHAAPASATALYVSETDANGTNIASLLGAIADGTPIRVQSVATETTFYTYTAGSPTDAGTYRSIPLTAIAGSGTLSGAVRLIWGDTLVMPFDLDYPSPGRWVKEDSDQVLIVTAPPTSTDGEAGDVAIVVNEASLENGSVYKRYGATWVKQLNILPRTITTAGYTQPAVGDTVTVAVTNPKLYPVGAAVYIDGGGAYVVTVQGASTLTLENLGGANTAATTVISSGKTVVATGRPATINSATGIVLDQVSTPSDPGTGKTHLYSKDGKLYFLPAGGVETEVGTGVEPLTLTYYLDEQDFSGSASDSNDGLTNTTPWSTLQKVLDLIADTPLNGGMLTIYVMAELDPNDGETELPTPLGGGLVRFIGESSAGAPYWTMDSVGVTGFTIPALSRYAFQNLQIVGTGQNAPLFHVLPGGHLDLGAAGSEVHFTLSGGTQYRYAVRVDQGGTCRVLGNLRVTPGSGPNLPIFLAKGGLMDFSQAATNPTITVVGTPEWESAFVESDGGRIQFADPLGVAAQFSGAATGVRYLARNGGIIDTNGAGSTYLPGDLAGVATTGYYL